MIYHCYAQLSACKIQNQTFLNMQEFRKDYPYELFLKKPEWHSEWKIVRDYTRDICDRETESIVRKKMPEKDLNLLKESGSLMVNELGSIDVSEYDWKINAGKQPCLMAGKLKNSWVYWYAKTLLATLPEGLRPVWVFITCPGNMEFLLSSWGWCICQFLLGETLISISIKSRCKVME